MSNKCSWIFIFLILNYICLFVSLFSKFFLLILLYLSILSLSMKSNCEFFVLFLRTFLSLCFLRFIMWILCIVLIYLLCILYYVFSVKKKKKEVLALLKLSVHSFAYCETFLKVKIDRASFKNFIGSIFSRLRHFAIETQKWFVILELHVKLYKNFKISFP